MGNLRADSSSLTTHLHACPTSLPALPCLSAHCSTLACAAGCGAASEGPRCWGPQRRALGLVAAEPALLHVDMDVDMDAAER